MAGLWFCMKRFRVTQATFASVCRFAFIYFRTTGLNCESNLIIIKKANSNILNSQKKKKGLGKYDCEPLTSKVNLNETFISEREHLVKTRRNTQILAHHWYWGIQKKVDKIGILTCKPKLTLTDWLICQIFVLFFTFCNTNGITIWICCLSGKVKVKVTQSLRYSPWNSLGQNTGVGSLSLLQGMFLPQGSNPDLPRCRRVFTNWAQGRPCISRPVANFSELGWGRRVMECQKILHFVETFPYQNYYFYFIQDN